VLGDAARLKVLDEFTVSEITTVFIRLPEPPVIVTFAVPTVAALLAESVRVLVPLVLVGLKVAVTPLGKPDADKPTVPEKPPWGVTVIVLVPLAPCMKVRLLGDALRAKPWIGFAPGQLFTRLVALMEPIPVAKSQPVVVPYAGANEVFEVDNTPTEPEGK
jgi:hypothetical protein